jgi:hypothetical protein
LVFFSTNNSSQPGVDPSGSENWKKVVQEGIPSFSFDEISDLLEQCAKGGDEFVRESLLLGSNLVQQVRYSLASSYL